MLPGKFQIGDSVVFKGKIESILFTNEGKTWYKICSSYSDTDSEYEYITGEIPAEFLFLDETPNSKSDNI
jgi:hypothetical protein